MKPVASSKANSSIVMVVDKENKVKYYVRNRLTVSDIETDVWDLAKRRYKRAIRIFREKIDTVLKEKYSPIPVYRDCDVSEILSLIRNNQGNDLALSIFQFLSKNNGK